jgi:K+-transporting ATPase ATPase C chain
MIPRQPLKTALLLFILLFLATGVVYPLAVTGIGELAFPAETHGSLVRDDQGNVTGSELIGIYFTGPAYFEGRPSSTPGGPDNAARSGGSNLGPSNPVLFMNVNRTVRHLEDLGMSGPWPGDLVTSSGSGLDPHISLDAALLQVPSVARARGMPEDALVSLVYTQVISNPVDPANPYVNVFSLNRALDRRDSP